MHDNKNHQPNRKKELVCANKSYPATKSASTRLVPSLTISEDEDNYTSLISARNNMFSNVNDSSSALINSSNNTSTTIQSNRNINSNNYNDEYNDDVETIESDAKQSKSYEMSNDSAIDVRSYG